MSVRRQDCDSDAEYERIRRFDESDPMESGVQRWGPGIVGRGSEHYIAPMKKRPDGDFILHADLLKIFAWMAEHEATFRRGYLYWFDGKWWNYQDVPDGDFLAAIVKLMGGDDE